MAVKDDLAAVVADAMQGHRVPGVAVGVYAGGVEHLAGYGITSVAHPLAVDADTLFQIGSISKTVTATAIQRLAQQGRLDLNAPVRSSLPDLCLADATATERVTLAHLLTHTAGFQGDHFPDTGDGDDALARYVAGMRDLPQLTPPGTTFAYCNSGFALAGRLVEVATGQPIERTLTDLVLRPVGMEHAYYFAKDVISHRFAVGHYIYEPGGDPSVARPWAMPRAINAVGGVVTSVRELLKYARFHLASADVADMRAARAVAGNFADAVGLAWLLRTLEGRTVAGHTGSTHGQTCSLDLVPDRDVAVVVLTNADAGRAVCHAVSAWALQRFAGVREPAPDVLHLSDEHLREYAGRYEAVLSSVTLHVKDGGLEARVSPKGGFPTQSSPPLPAPPPAQLAFFDTDRALRLGSGYYEGRCEFVRDARGRIAWLRNGGRLARRQTAPS
jgi:CubicO group peptidase (beta-lactamase class C family)